MIGGADGINGLGRHYGDDLYRCEIDYLIDREWARTSTDILWRRSKLGLHLAPATVQALGAALGETGLAPAAKVGGGGM
jgi:glycerol-3-phosphate dehydrogenase